MDKKINVFADLETLEQGALDQFHSAMELDCSIAGALMPDAHQGYSLPIGGVVATEGKIFPSWVGYDIGCGMCATWVPRSREWVMEHRDEIFEKIYELVPVGFNHHDEPEFVSKALVEVPDFTDVMKDVYFMKNHPFCQLGTLGGGNHFIELGWTRNENYDTPSDDVWLVIHSGSRNFGWQIARQYMILASGTGKASEGHFGFDFNSDLGQQYWQDMNLCLQFALDNRRAIMKLVFKAMGLDLDEHDDMIINRNHNHATFAPGEQGKVLIHRKGATHAEEGMWGVIPGNMRDGSFIVKGKGNPDSLWSSSHGAGRVLGRAQAKRELTLAEFQDAMDGIKARVQNSTLDESPMAYKDIFAVMDQQRDLVEVVHHIKPILNVKG